MGSSSFPLFFLVLGVSGWLKQRRNTCKKEYDTVPCLLVVFGIPFAFSLHLMQSQVRRNAWPQADTRAPSDLVINQK